MKKLYHLLAGIALILVTIIACDNSSMEIEELQTVQDKFPEISKNQVVFEGTFELSGVQNYYTYDKNSKLPPIQNEDIPADAVLESLEGNDIRLTLTEHLGWADRISVLEGKITPSGVIKMEYLRGATFNSPSDGTLLFYVDETIPDIVRANSGCSVNGQFPVWHGTFDGTSLIANSHFNSMCPYIDGPAYWNWSIEMTVE